MIKNFAVFLLGWVYYILPIILFFIPIAFIFSIGYIFGANSTEKITDIYSILGSMSKIATFLIALIAAIYWKPKFFTIKLMEKILEAKDIIPEINRNVSSSLVSIRHIIKNKNVNNFVHNPINIEECIYDLNKVINPEKTEKRDDLFKLYQLEDYLSLFSPQESENIKNIFHEYREYVYLVYFPKFRLEAKVGEEIELKSTNGKKFFPHKGNFKFRLYLPENIRNLSIENDIDKMGLKYSNGEYMGDFSLNELEIFYDHLNDELIKTKEHLDDMLNNSIAKKMKPSLFV